MKQQEGRGGGRVKQSHQPRLLVSVLPGCSQRESLGLFVRVQGTVGQL